ncbi:MAG: sirohydrochlorin chelatase, partial [Mariprofundaceae bacterium]
AHGSPDEAYKKAAGELASAVAVKLNKPVRIHFLNEEEVTKGGRVLPLFLGEGKHVSEDVRTMAERSNWQLLPSLTTYADDLAVILTTAVRDLDARAKAVILAPYRFSGMQKFVAALYKRSRRLPLPAIAALHRSPNVKDVLKLWQEEEVGPVALQPALIFPGKSYASLLDTVEQFCAEGMEISVGKPLSAQAGFIDLLVRFFQVD